MKKQRKKLKGKGKWEHGGGVSYLIIEDQRKE